MVAEGRNLKVNASQVKEPLALRQIERIQAALLTAAGVSDKAAGHFLGPDKVAAIENLITEFLEPAGNAFVEELVFRFLLTRGDTLGGSMRNVGGVLASRKLARAVIAALTNAGVPFRWLHNAAGVWADMPQGGLSGLENDLRGLSWPTGGDFRTLVYNLKVPMVGNNVDLCLLRCFGDAFRAGAHKDVGSYAALGELKGGIDPAGADEHWKTARSALARIRDAFRKRRQSPALFFVGAAIEPKMAREIWDDLEAGMLENAANLTSEDQVASLCSWLCEI